MPSLARGARRRTCPARGDHRHRLARIPFPRPSSRSRPTGRSAARTSSSATTAPSRIPGSAQTIDVSPGRLPARSSWARFEPGGAATRQNGNSFLDGGEVPWSQFHFLWPNFGLNVFPGHPNLSCGPMLPLGPERTGRFLDYFFAPERRPGMDRRADRLRQPGGQRGPRARRRRPARGSLGNPGRGPHPLRERAARRPLPAPLRGSSRRLASAAHGDRHLRPRHQGLRRRHSCGRRPRPADQGRRVPRPRRPVRVREDDRAPLRRRARGDHGRTDQDRRARRQPCSFEGPEHRDGVPVLRALPAHDGVRQPCIRAEAS